ncbi:hypothetical protein EHS25_004062 [Saitozyma podzolica]|uniref:EF-hand domain-containing protein n=1 Tax=Saitozyma podzolica TaxID=1890683 RepID=A0A427YT56_9TREE|nr:hypothetical protein EHS25_004062 [Saitozyma podzolica]
MSDPTSSTSTSNPSSSSTSSSSSASSSSSSSPPPSTSASSSSSSPSASKPPHYTLQPQSPHTDPSYRPSPLEPVQLPPPAPCLREPPSSDLIPASRPTLTQFRASEGPATRSAKLHALWEDLPKLPELGDGPTALQRMKLPGQDTTTALSPERAERLRKLYEEELVRRVKEKRPEARLWGGADDQPHFKSTQEKGIAFEDFRRFLWDQERELWDIFQELDKNGDGRLDASEMRAALSRSGIDITPATVNDLVRFLASNGSGQPAGKGEGGRGGRAGGRVVGAGGPHSAEDMYITFSEFRDFLIMLPRKATPFEIYKFYQVRKRFSDGRGAARVDKEGDLNVSFPKRPPPPPSHEGEEGKGEDFADTLDEEEEVQLDRHEAWRFLLAGGIAGAVALVFSKPRGHLGISFLPIQRLIHGGAISSSAAIWHYAYAAREWLLSAHLSDFQPDNSRPGLASPLVPHLHHLRNLLWTPLTRPVSRSVTAPFDRLKVYLITTAETAYQQHPGGRKGLAHPFRVAGTAVGNLWLAVTRIYQTGGGVRAFWVGNGLNVTKIFPESAIKFVSYEQSKRFLAKYWDKVSDPSELSSSSRFIAGGIGGITSQFAIYGLETLKTRIQSEVGPSMGWRSVVKQARSMWVHGGIRAYYRGLTLGLIGVFPYSAIDMGTYETLKTTYCRSTGVDEPPVFAVLSFGALSGSIGAASVYPVNLLRTRLQASGSSGHPQAYKGFRDVFQQTLQKEGWRGLYKGLLPSILKVGPAVGVSWIVYEDAKRRLEV